MICLDSSLSRLGGGTPKYVGGGVKGDKINYSGRGRWPQRISPSELHYRFY